jgi:hypothetical protein
MRGFCKLKHPPVGEGADILGEQLELGSRMLNSLKRPMDLGLKVYIRMEKGKKEKGWGIGEINIRVCNSPSQRGEGKFCQTDSHQSYLSIAINQNLQCNRTEAPMAKHSSRLHLASCPCLWPLEPNNDARTPDMGEIRIDSVPHQAEAARQSLKIFREHIRPIPFYLLFLYPTRLSSSLCI